VKSTNVFVSERPALEAARKESAEQRAKDDTLRRRLMRKPLAFSDHGGGLSLAYKRPLTL
jgi:hypothetical protein